MRYQSFLSFLSLRSTGVREAIEYNTVPVRTSAAPVHIIVLFSCSGPREPNRRMLMRSETAFRTTNTSVTVSEDTREVSRWTPATQIICVKVFRIRGMYPLGSDHGVG